MLLVLMTGFVVCACNVVKQNIVPIVRFERQGGGNLEFVAHLNATADMLSVVVERMQFRDTLITKNIAKCSANAAVFDAFSSLKIDEITQNADVNPKTDIQSRMLCTGTWAHFYINSDTGFVEVSNKKVQTQLLPLENLVRKEICGE